MSLLQNQFGMETVTGTKVSGNNVMTCEFYSATSTDTITPGEFITLASTTSPNVTKVSVGDDATADFFGVVLTNPLKESYAVGDKLEIAMGYTSVMCTASAAITCGDKLAYDPATKKVYEAGESDTIVGIALCNAAAANDLVRVLVNTNF